MSVYGGEPGESGGRWMPTPLGTDKASIELQGIYLRRLRRLLQLRRDHEGQLNSEGIRLLDRSIYATYCDCINVGAPEAAQEVLRRFPVTLSSFPDEFSL
jgi:hypothetical protein